MKRESKHVRVHRSEHFTSWTVDGHRYYWNGPGSRLKLVFGDTLVPIEHPTADGSYRTYREADLALRRFLGMKARRR